MNSAERTTTIDEMERTAGSNSNCSVWKISTGSGTAPPVDRNTLTGTSPNDMMNA